MPTGAELLAAYVIGRSQDAFADLCTHYAPFIRDRCRLHLGETLWTDDAVLDVLCVLAEDAASIDPERIEAWLSKTAKNVCANFRRGEVRRRRHELACGVGSTNAEMAVATMPERCSDAEIALESALGKLDEKQRRAVSLRHLEGRNVEDVAREMGASRHAVNYYLWRGLARLRELLKNAGITLPLLIPLPFRMRFRRAGLLASPKTAAAAVVVIVAASATGIVVTRSYRPPIQMPAAPHQLIAARAPLPIPESPQPPFMPLPGGSRAGLFTRGDSVGQAFSGLNYMSEYRGDMHIDVDWESLGSIGIGRDDFSTFSMDPGTLMEQLDQLLRQIAPPGALRAVVRGDHIVVERNPDFTANKSAGAATQSARFR